MLHPTADLGPPQDVLGLDQSLAPQPSAEAVLLRMIHEARVAVAVLIADARFLSLSRPRREVRAHGGTAATPGPFPDPSLLPAVNLRLGVRNSTPDPCRLLRADAMLHYLVRLPLSAQTNNGVEATPGHPLAVGQ